MKKVEFTKGNWETCFNYAYSKRFPFNPEFAQENDCIVNKRNPEMADGFDYTTIMLKEPYGEGTKFSFTCSFEEYGAPLFTITDKMETDENGCWHYGDCYEVVLWENGINVWDLYEEDGAIKWNKVMSLEFPVKSNKKHKMFLELIDNVGEKELNSPKYTKCYEFDNLYAKPININTVDEFSLSDIKRMYKVYYLGKK